MLPETETPHRVFTYEQARDLLPAVRQITQQFIARMSVLETPIADDDTGDAVQERWRDEAAVVLSQWAEKVEELGIVVKGPWLIDFDSGSGYYCWKWPEESLEFFHGYDEGFASRLRLQ